MRLPLHKTLPGRAASAIALAAVQCVVAAAAEPSAEIADEHRRFFENRIRPLLVAHCCECHASQGEPKAGLALDSRAGLLRGGDGGPVLTPGDPDASRLVAAVRYDDVALQMPPQGRLAPQQIADLEEWVRIGAPDPREDASSAPVADRTFDWRSRAAQHWAWQPAARPPLPAVHDAGWPRSAADRFVLARLEQAGLRPAPEADRRVWLRRVAFDLTGLPPTPEEAAAFDADPEPQAWERAVDRLLASPRFGEQWAQHWLDLVRFAETYGHEQDFPIEQAWRYRDYAIRAFNQDVAYDAWIVEHVAGDLVPAPRIDPVDRSNQSIQGTGFWHFGEATHSPVDIAGDEADRVQNQIDVFSRAFLGLSMGCARCHDHKFDAISTHDYYALFGYLQSSSYELADVADPHRIAATAEGLASLIRLRAPELRQKVAALRRAQLARLARELPLAADRAAVDGAASAAAVGGASDAVGGPSASDEASDAWPTDAPTRERIVRLARYLREAAERPDDLLHLFARVAATSRNATSPEAAASIDEVRAAWRPLSAGPAPPAADASSAPLTVVEDFEAAPHAADRWLASGRRFGDGPAQPGDWLLEGASPDAWRVAETSEAASNRLSGKLGGMLRTRTFEIVGPTLWYRYRGSADVFLSVDSHRVVAGPLHQAVRQKLRGDPRAWQWFAHPVAEYQGRRVHVEFTPHGEAPFAIDRIACGSSPPASGPHLSRLHREQLAESIGPDRPWPEALAQATLRPLAAAVERFAVGDADGDDARALNWLAAHPEFLAADVPEQAAATTAAESFAAERLAWERALPPPILALTLRDGSGEDEPVHVRGNHRVTSRQRQPRRRLAALGGEDDPPPERGSGRLEFARRLAAPDNPLVARVHVNRVWAQLMGSGLVATVDDFGAMGARPTHPELLDFLAARFVEEGWSTKALIRDLALSATYRMASRGAAAADEADPNNALRHRADVRRLPAESIRDAWLAVSGRLDRTPYGPSVAMHISDFMRSNRSPEGSGPLDGDNRRSIYLEVRRNHMAPALTAFDKPVPFHAIGLRGVSNSPAQSLILMNDPLVQQLARSWAESLRAVDGETERIERAYLAAFLRVPTEAERARTGRFLDDQQQRYALLGEQSPREKAWDDLCHALFCAKEFIYLN